MADEDTMPDRVGSQTNVPIPAYVGIPVVLPGHVGAEMDNVLKAEAPSGLNESVPTEWDAATLDQAVTWLESHAEYLNRLRYQMVDLKDVMGGNGGKAPFGTLDWAVTLAQKHNGLYTSTEAAVKKLSDDLYAAAAALRNVKENYDRAEERNAMSAADMQQVFATAARSPHA